MAEMLLGHSWTAGQLAPCEGLVSIGRQRGDQIIHVPWGARATRSWGGGTFACGLCCGCAGLRAGRQQYGSRGTRYCGARLCNPTDHVKRRSFAQMALARTNLMAGTLQSTLDLGLQFAAEREQFGRSISKFQAIQHSLAVVAAEVAAAQRAADAGVDALGTDRFIAEVAASKREWARQSVSLLNKCTRYMVPWALPMSIGCIISPGDFGLGATNGATKPIGSECWRKNSWPRCGSGLGLYRYKRLTQNRDSVCRQISAVSP